MGEKISLIYIVGSGHCGSTLLDIVLDSHSQIIGVGELYQYGLNNRENLVCTCNKRVVDCNFWKKIFSGINFNFHLKIFRNKKDFLLNKKSFFQLDEEGRVLNSINNDDYLSIHEKIYSRIAGISGKNVIVDSSKDPDRLELLLQSRRLEILILHLVRDARAVAWSYKKKYKDIVIPVGGQNRWLGKNLKTEIIKNRNKTKKIFISYEKFCKNPEKQLKRILKKLNLKFEPEMLKFRSKIHHQIEGNRLRFREDDTIRLDEKWKREMPLINKIKNNLVSGWLNLYYKFKK